MQTDVQLPLTGFQFLAKVNTDHAQYSQPQLYLILSTSCEVYIVTLCE